MNLHLSLLLSNILQVAIFSFIPSNSFYFCDISIHLFSCVAAISLSKSELIFCVLLNLSYSISALLVYFPFVYTTEKSSVVVSFFYIYPSISAIILSISSRKTCSRATISFSSALSFTISIFSRVSFCST